MAVLQIVFNIKDLLYCCLNPVLECTQLLSILIPRLGRENTCFVCVCVCVRMCTDASGVLFTQEVSLSNLLDPVWVVPHQESCLKLQQEEQPVQSPAEGVAVTAPRISRCGERFFLGENYSSPLAHERQLLAENHTPITVIENYTPCCLDNHEYFVGKNITTLTPQGYRVGGERGGEGGCRW